MSPYHCCYAWYALHCDRFLAWITCGFFPFPQLHIRRAGEEWDGTEGLNVKIASNHHTFTTTSAIVMQGRWRSKKTVFFLSMRQTSTSTTTATTITITITTQKDGLVTWIGKTWLFIHSLTFTDSKRVAMHSLVRSSHSFFSTESLSFRIFSREESQKFTWHRLESYLNWEENAPSYIMFYLRFQSISVFHVQTTARWWWWCVFRKEDRISK